MEGDAERSGPDVPASPGRRAVLGAAGLAAVVGAGAGAAGAGLLRSEPEPDLRLARGSSPGGDGGPWSYVAPGGSVQEAIDAGARAILLGDGEYPVDRPIVPAPGTTIRGIGHRSRLIAVADLPAVIAVGDGGPVDNVAVADLLVDAARRAHTAIDLDIVGIPPGYQQDPDSVCRLDNLWVFDAADTGIAYRGTDTQACVTTRVRVRRAARFGFRIEAPDNVWVACEATTQEPGGAGFYVGTAVEGSDGIGAANDHFHACKAWYCRGVGWHVATGRNSFVGCEAQDTAGHGWWVQGARVTLTGCMADTAAMADVGGRPGEADGFHVEPDDELALVGCLAFDRSPGGLPPQQRHGFNVPDRLVQRGLLTGCTGWGNTGDLVHTR